MTREVEEQAGEEGNRNEKMGSYPRPAYLPEPSLATARFPTQLRSVFYCFGDTHIVPTQTHRYKIKGIYEFPS